MMKKLYSEDIVALSKERDFCRTYRKGSSHVSFCVVAYINKNFNKRTRLGITASKKVGNAVKRNRARRVIREACLSLLKGKCLGNVDVVLVARARTAFVKSYVVKANLEKIFKEAGL